MDTTLTLNDVLVIAAIVIGPILAVQVEKFLELRRDDNRRKVQIYKTLMATRAAGVSAEHVQALNLIDLEFREKEFKRTRQAWRAYLDHLGTFPENGNETEQTVWSNKTNDLLATLLVEMGQGLNYDFDLVDIKKGIYSPRAHSTQETENQLLRRGLLQLLYGNSALKMDVERFPYDEEATEEQRKLNRLMAEVIDGQRKFSVDVSDALLSQEDGD
ncbi:MAG: DUF6680 family protein [Gammaproteobacteria bacterium]|nr:DUF6680 family protein [Gammaproteobacteria bacterium]